MGSTAPVNSQLIHGGKAATSTRKNPVPLQPENGTMQKPSDRLHRTPATRSVLTWEECHQVSSRQGDFTKHKNIHSQPSTCPGVTYRYHCEGFSSEQYLERHYNAKLDPNPHYYSCEDCSHKSKYETDRKKHMADRHKAGHYTCEYCSFMSKHDHQLKKRVMEHHDPTLRYHTYQYCSQNTRYKGNLRSHLEFMY